MLALVGEPMGLTAGAGRMRSAVIRDRSLLDPYAHADGTDVSDQQIPAFPGAEGFGATTPGGRGGMVIAVTNLSDDGPGSFRAAVEAEGKRIVIFRVSGLITLTRKLIIKNPYITIAGQTAPG